MKTWALLFFLAGLLPIQLSGQSFRLVSWNIQYLGKTKSDTELQRMADILRDADLVAVQEVVAGYGGPQAVARLADALNRTGAQWDYRISEPTRNAGKGVSERYAFLFKTSRISCVGEPYLETSLSYSVPREPYTGRFVQGRDTFLLITFHARPHNRNPERGIREVLPMYRKYRGERVLFAADWNVNEENEVFRDFRNNGYRPVLRRTRTTLRRSINPDGVYFAHAIDNIWYHLEDFQLEGSGIIDLVQSTGSLEAARQLSDHVPVWAEFTSGDP